MKELIDRNEILKTITSYKGVVDKSVAKRIILQMPIKIGHWVDFIEDNYTQGSAYMCDCCKKIFFWEDIAQYNYCPYCGDYKGEIDKEYKLKIGKWKRKDGNYVTPGGTPLYCCDNCGGSEHLHGVEFPKRKVICDECGSINIYPWERSYENG